MRLTVLSGLTHDTTTKIKLAVLFLLALKAVDGFWTMWAVNNGYVEVNPIMAPIAHTLWEPIATILPTTIFGVFALWISRKYPHVSKIMLYGILVSCVLMIFVLASNLREVLN